MLKIFEKNIKAVRVRCSINLLLKYTGQILIIAGVIAILALMFERLIALQIINPATLISFTVLVILFILGFWIYKQPSKMQISLLLDERMGLKERFSTALKISENHDPFAEAACKEALGKAQSLNLQGHFPIKLSKGWAYTGTLWLIVVLLFAFMPQKDLFGIQGRRNKENDIAKKKEEAKSLVKEATDKIKLQMKELGDPNLAEALGKLGNMPPEVKPQDIKREAIRQLSDLSEQVKNMQKNETFASMQMMQQMLKQLKGSPDEFANKLRMEMAKGNFGQAAALLKEMQKELQEGKMTEEQKKRMSEQMQALSEALKELAEQSEQMEKELEAMGLKKELAQMSEKELRDALEKQGLSSDKIEELMKKAAASNMASQKMSEMANAMSNGSMQGNGSGMSPGSLADAIEQLDSMEALQQQMMMNEATLRQIANAINGIGQGMGNGSGQGQGIGEGYGDFMEGYGDQFNNGTGGPGMGEGERATDTDGQYNTQQEMDNQKGRQGPIIASWYVKDIQVEGQTKRELSEVIQAGRESAAEAISENEIPRRYEDAIKSYFGNIEESFPAAMGASDQE